MLKFSDLSVGLVGVIAVSAMALSAPSYAEEEVAWDENVVVALAIRLDSLIGGIRGKIVRADSVADAMFSRRTAVARATLADLEKATRQLATELKAGAARDATLGTYENVRALRAQLKAQATEVGFADPAMTLIVEARAVLGELDKYYGVQ
jgi:hypothetical protein